MLPGVELAGWSSATSSVRSLVHGELIRSHLATRVPSLPGTTARPAGWPGFRRLSRDRLESTANPRSWASTSCSLPAARRAPRRPLLSSRGKRRSGGGEPGCHVEEWVRSILPGSRAQPWLGRRPRHTRRDRHRRTGVPRHRPGRPAGRGTLATKVYGASRAPRWRSSSW